MFDLNKNILNKKSHESYQDLECEYEYYINKLTNDLHPNMKNVPKRIRTHEFYLRFVKRYHFNIYYVPKNMINSEMCDVAFLLHPMNIQFFPKNLITYEMIKHISKTEIWSDLYGYIPKKLITNEIVNNVISTNLNDIWKVPHIPKCFLNYNIATIIVKKNGTHLSHIPYNIIDYELCKVACKSYLYINGFRYVPNKFKDYELCLLAVRHYTLNLQFVPKKYKDYPMCLSAYDPKYNKYTDFSNYYYVKTNNLSKKYFKHVPKKYKTYKFYEDVIKLSPQLLPFIPKKFLDSKLIFTAIKFGGDLFDLYKNIHPENVNTSYVYSLLIEASKNKNFLLGKYINEPIFKNLIDYDICLQAAKSDNLNLLDLPNKFINYEFMIILSKCIIFDHYLTGGVNILSNHISLIIINAWYMKNYIIINADSLYELMNVIIRKQKIIKMHLCL